MVKHSIGCDPYVEVLDMQQRSDIDFVIPIEVRDWHKALALAATLVPSKNFGNINVFVEVRHCGNVVPLNCLTEDAHCLVQKALDTNDYFERLESVDFFGSTILFPVFKKAVIQFFNDDLSDYYNNFNGVVADVFSEVLNPSVGNSAVRPSTATD